jgi:hypothetical protein
MKGLEPSTFCLANASVRSRPFVPVCSDRPFAGFSFLRANATEPERTPNLAMLATDSGDEPRLEPKPLRPRSCGLLILLCSAFLVSFALAALAIAVERHVTAAHTTES